MKQANILSDFRVLDFSKVLAGPLCAQYLGDMGADVLKIEPVQSGDDTRSFPPFVRAGNHADGTIFLSANRNKRSIAIDLKHTKGRALVHRLVQDSDIVVESYGPGVAQRLGVDFDTLRKINPRLIHCSISGYGNIGPMKHGKGYDAVLQSFSGMMSITGERHGRPARSPYSPVDQATGLHALSGILAAIIERQKTGVGVHVETNLFDTSLAFLGYILQSLWQTGQEPERPGSSHDSLCPYEVFDTADRPVLLGVANDTLWRKFCQVAGAPELACAPDMRTNALRVEHRTATVAAVGALLSRRTRSEWLDALAEAGVPCSPVQTLTEMLTHPHTAASGMVGEYEHPVFGRLKTVAQPLRFCGERNQQYQPPPLLGQNTVDVLRELGLETAEIHALASEKVVYIHQEHETSLSTTHERSMK